MAAMMDKGILYEKPFEIRPFANGGFIVISSRSDRMEDDLIGAFTNITDLLNFLNEQAAFKILTEPKASDQAKYAATYLHNSEANLERVSGKRFKDAVLRSNKQNASVFPAEGEGL